MIHRVLKYSAFILLILIVAFPLFTHLDRMPLRIWDEARIAVSAYEMYDNGNLLIPHYEGEPDMWSTKPPFLLWCQVFTMNIIGPSVLATRLPIAIASLLICAAFLYISRRLFNNKLLGVIASFILVSSYGFVHIHMSRTGDYDVLLALFVFVSSLCIYLFTEKKNALYLYVFFLVLALGVLTKSISALFLTPALLIYIIYKKSLVATLKNKHLYVALSLFLFISLTYYLLREHYNPGFLEAVWNNELGGRFNKALESHRQDSWYYVKLLFSEQWPYWFYFLIPSILWLPFEKDAAIKRFSLFLLFMVIGYLLVISTSATKIFWYDAPVFPFLALFVALFLFRIYTIGRNIIGHWALLIFPVIISYPYARVIDKTFLPQESDYNENQDSYEIGYLMRDELNGSTFLQNKTFVYYDYNAHILFYQYLLEEQNKPINTASPEELRVGQEVFAYQPAVKHYIQMYYDVTLQDKRGDVEFYKILKKK